MVYYATMSKQRWYTYDNVKSAFQEWLKNPNPTTGKVYSSNTIKNYLSDIDNVTLSLYYKKNVPAWEFLATEICAALTIYNEINKGGHIIASSGSSIKEQIEYQKRVANQLQDAQHIKKVFSVKLYVRDSHKDNYIGRILQSELSFHLSLFDSIARMFGKVIEESSLAALGKMYDHNLDEKIARNFAKKGFPKGIVDENGIQLIVDSQKTKETTKQFNALVLFAQFLQGTLKTGKRIPTYSRLLTGGKDKLRVGSRIVYLTIPTGIDDTLSTIESETPFEPVVAITWYGNKIPSLPAKGSFSKREIAEFFRCDVHTLGRIPKFKSKRKYTSAEITAYMEDHSQFLTHPGVKYNKADSTLNKKFTFWKTVSEITEDKSEQRYLQAHYEIFTYVAYVPGNKRFYAPEVRTYFRKHPRRKNKA